jgi:hypothetical protein
MLSEGGTDHLDSADAPDGKWHGLGQTIAALGLHGILVIDDMTPMPDWPGNQRAGQNQGSSALLTAPQVISVELAHGSGVILSTRQ